MQAKLPELTYFFGAGASCQAMPLVNSFSTRFKIYIKFLQRVGPDQSFVKSNITFLQSLQSHLSFDTYFKKLFHQRNKIKEIQSQKYLLHLFLLYEHLLRPELCNRLASDSGIECHKEYACDPRYDALIAALLKPLPEKAEFYCPVNFLTWNYDLNLLYSIYNFLGEGVSFVEFLKKGYVSRNTFKFNDYLKVIHHNGFMNFEHWVGSPGYAGFEEISDYFNKHIGNRNNEDYVESTISTLNFSWENMGTSNVLPEFIHNATNAIQQSENIIFSGYSFPLYNRLFDQVMLDRKNLFKKSIYIIDKVSDQIKSRIRSEFDIPEFEELDKYAGDSRPPSIFTSDDVNAFMVPPSLF